MAGARAADLWSTHALDPTLDGEQNLAHALLGFDFLGLVGLNLLVLAGLAFLFVRSLRLTSGLAPSQPGLAFRPFLSHFLLEGRYPWHQILWRTPGRRRAHWLLGRMVVAPTLAVSVLAFAGNLLSYQAPGFARVWAGLVGHPLGLMATLAACIAVALAGWLLAEYALYRRRAVGGGTLVAEAVFQFDLGRRDMRHGAVVQHVGDRAGPRGPQGRHPLRKPAGGT
ncbi:MAG: hypothetical protein QOD77_1530 [Thermoplasmata archaeon]|jgi:hypothetical protein|nr:hypothetical protein [Thermoplasmata archaeon]